MAANVLLFALAGIRWLESDARRNAKLDLLRNVPRG
jgi:hypothetical protein